MCEDFPAHIHAVIDLSSFSMRRLFFGLTLPAPTLMGTRITTHHDTFRHELVAVTEGTSMVITITIFRRGLVVSEWGIAAQKCFVGVQVSTDWNMRWVLNHSNIRCVKFFKVCLMQ